MTDRLAGRAVLVTGGSTGIGLAAAARLAAEGATVFITGRRQAELDKAAAQIGAAAVPVQGDVTSRADLDRLFGTIADRTGTLDGVVANAGGGTPVPLGRYDDAAFEERFGVNVKGVAYTVQGAAPLMRPGGSIVIVGSISGLTGMPQFGLYAASKAAVRSFARTWSLELRHQGIRVNVVTPGIIYTTSQIAAGMSREDFDPAIPNIPLGRLGDPDDVSGVIAFLLSDDSRYMTASEVVVDGGMTQV